MPRGKRYVHQKKFGPDVFTYLKYTSGHTYFDRFAGVVIQAGKRASFRRLTFSRLLMSYLVENQDKKISKKDLGDLYVDYQERIFSMVGKNGMSDATRRELKGIFGNLRDSKVVAEKVRSAIRELNLLFERHEIDLKVLGETGRGAVGFNFRVNYPVREFKKR